MGIFLLVSLTMISMAKPVKEYLQIPKQIVMFEGEAMRFSSTALPVQTTVKDASKSIEIHKHAHSFSVKAKQRGEKQMVLEVAGMPVKQVDVKVLPSLKVIPGGQSIGVKLNTVGVLVVGYHLVETENGKKSPGELAGIKVGDMITGINGKKSKTWMIFPLLLKRQEK